MEVLHFVSICHVIQWEFHISFIFLQLSMLFNGKFAFCQFSMLFNGKFAFYQFPMLFNGNLKLEKLGGGMYHQTYVMVHPCVLQDIGPLGPLPKKDEDDFEKK